MAGDTVITIVGNLTGDPELRFTPNGAAVANFTIASTPRNFDKQSGEWKEGETLFLRAAVWREAAENVAESLKKGMRVMAQGRLQSRSYETKEGEKRTSFELEVDEIGPSLRFATANVSRNQRNNTSPGNGQQWGGQQGGYNNGAPQGQGNQQWGNGAQNQNLGNGYSAPQGGYNNGAPAQGGAPAANAQAPQTDPWSQQAAGNYDWGNGANDEPPF